jgi:type III secretion system (T3SS) inner membrane Yop/YscD-like protein
VTVRCPSCNEPFTVAREAGDKATAPCPRCGRVVVTGAPRAAAADDPQTEPHLERLAPGEEPTRVGAAAATLSLPTGKRVSVVVASGPRKGNRVTLDRPRLTLGQAGSGSDLEVPDPDISPSHAAVECHGARIVLRDLGSRAGTFVGDERVSQREVEDQTEFRLAGTTFLLLVADD